MQELNGIEFNGCYLVMPLLLVRTRIQCRKWALSTFQSWIYKRLISSYRIQLKEVCSDLNLPIFVHVYLGK